MVKFRDVTVWLTKSNFFLAKGLSFCVLLKGTKYFSRLIIILFTDYRFWCFIKWNFHLKKKLKLEWLKLISFKIILNPNWHQWAFFNNAFYVFFPQKFFLFFSRRFSTTVTHCWANAFWVINIFWCVAVSNKEIIRPFLVCWKCKNIDQ